MKKRKILITIIIFILLFAILHCYTEWRFNSDNPPKGVIDRIEEWIGESDQSE